MPTPYEEGPLDADICIVAEAPSTVELVRGRPLVGPAGKLANEYLSEAEIPRSECRIVNVLKEPIRSVEPYLGKNGLTPLGLRAKEEFTGRFNAGRHNTVVAFGALACAVLTGDRRIMKMRGSPLNCIIQPGTEVIPTVHPAATMGYKGNTIWKWLIIADLRKALVHSTKKGIQSSADKRTLRIRPSYADAVEFIDWMCHSDTVAFDIEVYNHQVSCISFANTPWEGMSIPFSHDYWSEEQEVNIWREISRLLNDENIAKVGQYVSFDISFLLSQNRVRVLGPILDTYISQRILYPDFPASLEFLCSIYSDQPYYKDDRKIWNKLDRDIERFWRYNTTDSCATLEVWENQSPELYADPDFLHTYNLTMQMLEPCLYMMTKGMRMDISALRQARVDLNSELAEKEKALEDISEIPFNPGSPQQCIKYFYIIKGLPAYISRKTKRPTCDDDALARIIRKYNLPEARLVQEIRSLRKLRDTYLELGYDSDERLRCFYNVRGTGTGRLSSSKTVRETGLNMQNLHPAFKKFLVPDEVT